MNKYIKKKDLIKQLENLHESLEAYKNLGMVYAREQEELAAEGDVDIDNQPIVERSEQIVSEILQMQKEITEEKYKSLIKHSVVPGDIVVAKMGEPIGRACIVPEYIDKAIIVADCMKIRPNISIINRKYLEFLLNTEEVKAQFRKYSQGSTRVRLNLTMLRQIKVLYPPIDLQNQFADFVKQVDKLKQFK